jgi:polyhydroxyalkanoate synthesis regulator phasin
MDVPARSAGQLASELALAAIGAAALTAERIDALADEIAAKGGMTREDARALLREQAERWREEATRVGGRASSLVGSLLADLGLVTSEKLDDLELRLAQLEHRLRLVEGGDSENSLRESLPEGQSPAAFTPP